MGRIILERQPTPEEWVDSWFTEPSIFNQTQTQPTPRRNSVQPTFKEESAPLPTVCGEVPQRGAEPCTHEPLAYQKQT